MTKPMRLLSLLLVLAGLAANACAVPPSAVQPFALSPTSPHTIAVDMSGAYAADSHQLESRAAYLAHLGPKRGPRDFAFLVGGGLAASSATTNTNASAHHWFSALPFIVFGVRLHNCHISTALSGGTGGGPSVWFTGGVIEGSMGCRTRSLQLSLRGLKHGYHSNNDASSATSASIVASYQAPFAVAPTVSLALSRRNASFTERQPADKFMPAEEIHDVERGWTIMVTAGISIAPMPRKRR
jgi:hypothetical protein